MKFRDEEASELIAHYRTLLETSIDGFFINVGWCFQYANPALQRMLGASSERELLGRRVLDFIDPASHRAVLERSEACQASLEPVSPLEEKYVRLDGSLVDVEVTAVAIVHGGQRAALVTVRDISKRKLAELAQRKLEEQLRQSQKMEALGTLAGGVAHDFNNILATVVGNAELGLGSLEPSHAARRHLCEILTATDRAKGVIAQVLAFSRRKPPERQVIDLRATVSQELCLLRAALPPGASLEARLASGACPVVAEATQMHQVLLNLCTNAWQAFEGRAGTIVIGLRCCDVPGDAPADLGPGRYAELSVADDGPGIDASIRERIFDPFFTTKRPDEGTGLGLSVVHGIAKSHGARVSCSSEAGVGTTFYLYLPLVLAEQQPAPARLPQAPLGRGQAILYLDDDAGLVELARETLQARGYRVTGFSLPALALAALRGNPEAFDLVITDLKMPLQTGLDVAQAVRIIKPSLPVILMSGFLEDRLQQRVADLGICTVLQKPLDAEGMCRAIANALQVAGAQPTRR